MFLNIRRFRRLPLRERTEEAYATTRIQMCFKIKSIKCKFIFDSNNILKLMAIISVSKYNFNECFTEYFMSKWAEN